MNINLYTKFLKLVEAFTSKCLGLVYALSDTKNLHVLCLKKKNLATTYSLFLKFLRFGFLIEREQLMFA